VEPESSLLVPPDRPFVNLPAFVARDATIDMVSVTGLGTALPRSSLLLNSVDRDAHRQSRVATISRDASRRSLLISERVAQFLFHAAVFEIRTGGFVGRLIDNRSSRKDRRFSPAPSGRKIVGPISPGERESSSTVPLRV
jgi:hypothetical protein